MTRFKACKEFEQLRPPTSGLQVKSFDQLPSPGDPELIVWSEQGLGDSIQFVRYLHLLQAADILFYSSRVIRCSLCSCSGLVVWSLNTFL